MPLITSSSNPTLKTYRKLRDRKERSASGLFAMEGLRIVGEAVQQGVELEALLTCPDLLVSEFGRKLVEEQSSRGVPTLEISREAFESISIKEGPQGLAALGRQRWMPLEEIHPHNGDLWVALDSISDPGNLGTILRTLDAVGGKGLILLDQSTDPYDPTALRGSMGSAFAMRLCKTSFASFSAWKQTCRVPVAGTSGAAQTDYQDCRYPIPLVVLSGSERQGLQPHHIQLCDFMVRIPMSGRADSLNLAMATGIVLYEVYNQHRRSSS